MPRTSTSNGHAYQSCKQPLARLQLKCREGLVGYEEREMRATDEPSAATLVSRTPYPSISIPTFSSSRAKVERPCQGHQHVMDMRISHANNRYLDSSQSGGKDWSDMKKGRRGPPVNHQQRPWSSRFHTSAFQFRPLVRVELTSSDHTNHAKESNM